MAACHVQLSYGVGRNPIQAVTVPPDKQQQQRRVPMPFVPSNVGTNVQSQLILMRHGNSNYPNFLNSENFFGILIDFGLGGGAGESMWNDLKLFTGYVDTPC